MTIDDLHQGLNTKDIASFVLSDLRPVDQVKVKSIQLAIGKLEQAAFWPGRRPFP